MNANAGHDGGDGVGSPGFSIVVAMDRNRGIGKDGDLPWPKLKGDMKFFRELTTCPDRAAVEKRWGLKTEESADVQKWEDVSAMLKFAHPLPAASDEKRNAVIMGRKTWESLPAEFRPLPDRVNIALTKRGISNLTEEINVGQFDSLIDEMQAIESGVMLPNPSLTYVIGGGQIFLEALKYHYCKHLYVTEIDAEFPCDTFFPETPDFKPALSSPWIEENGIRYRFRRYDRVSA